MPKQTTEILSSNKEHSLTRILVSTGDSIRAESEDEIPAATIFKIKTPKGCALSVKGKFSVVSCEEMSEGGNYAVNLKRV